MLWEQKKFEGNFFNRVGVIFSVLGLILFWTKELDTRNRRIERFSQALGTQSAIENESDKEDSTKVDLFKIPLLGRWQTFSLADGLPSEKVFCVRADGERIWVGTEAGLACYEGGAWRHWGVSDGLPHSVVLSLDVSPHTKDLWIGTMGGLARLSGGRMDAFTQLSSGLSNDFVNDVHCDPEENQVWAATAMGLSRLDLNTGEWHIFTQQNTPMAEPWTYSVEADRGLVYVGAWGAGILELEKRSGRWREYRDPDKEMEIDLLPDDGPVHDVTSGIDFKDGILWQATYFGLARYDGRSWRTYFTKDSGLASDFIQFIRVHKKMAWSATDQGLSATDGTRWVTYRRREDGQGEILLSQGRELLKTIVTQSAMAHNFVLGLDWQGDAIWVATEKGLSRGEPDPAIQTPDIRQNDVTSPVTKMTDKSAIPVSDTTTITKSASPQDLRPERFHYANTPDEFLPYRHLPVYNEFFTTLPAFWGAGREKNDPEVEDIRIGFIGPLGNEEHPILPEGFRSGVQGNSQIELFGKPMLQGVELAIEAANRTGGYQGKPFRLLRRTDLVQWGQSSNELAQFAYVNRVWAIVSGMDSNHQHVLARSALKAEIPIVNAGSSDPTLLEHAIPWIVRVMSDDRQNSYVMLDYLFNVRKLVHVAVLRLNDRDGRLGIVEFIQGARRGNHPIVIEQRFQNGDTDFSEQLDRIAQTHADALFILGNPIELGLIVKAVRERGMGLPVFSFDRCVHPKFLEIAGSFAEGVIATTAFYPDPGEATWQSFQAEYRNRFGEEPNAWSAYAYDGTNLVLTAIKMAGLNRARIRDALFSQKTFDGLTGVITFDTTMNNIRKPRLVEVKNGKWREL